MAVKMKRYLEEQPAVWQDILSRRRELAEPFVRALEGRKISRFLLVGTGSSGNAAMAALPLWETLLKREITLAAPTRLGAVLPDPETTLVLAISQSGRSTSTLAAVKRLRKEGFSVAAVTADENSPVAGAADFHLLIACGEETVGPKTKGFTATVLTLDLAALALAEAWGTPDEKTIEGCVAALSRSFRLAPENIARCREFCEKNMDVLAPQPHFTLIADGIGLPVAMEGALKVLETLYVPAFAYEFEEYLHGVNNTIGAGQCNFLVISGAENAGRMLRLDGFCAKQGCADFVVTTLEVPGASHILKLSGSGEPFTQPFETLLLFQVLSALGSERKGHQVDQPKFSGFYGEMETKL